MCKRYLPQVGSFDRLNFPQKSNKNPQRYVKKGRRSVIYIAGCDAGGFWIGLDSDLQLNHPEAQLRWCSIRSVR